MPLDSYFETEKIKKENQPGEKKQRRSYEKDTVTVGTR